MDLRHVCYYDRIGGGIGGDATGIKDITILSR